MNKTAKVLVTIGVAFLFIIFGVTVGATKPTDITKTGPRTYRDIQREIEALYQSGLDKELVDKLVKLEREYVPVTLRGSMEETSRHAVSSPLSQSDTPWGESFFDEKSANAYEFQHLEDIRAKNVGRTLGILGLIAFCVIIIGVMKSIWKKDKSDKNNNSFLQK